MTELHYGDPVDPLAEKQRIRELVYRYSYCTDTNRLAELAELFTEDCNFDPGPGSGGPLSGPAAVVELRRRSSVLASSHHNTNVQVEFTSSSTATVRSAFHAWHRTAASEPLVWGYYDDDVVLVDGQWLFQSRVIRVYGEQGFGGVWNPGERLA